MSVQAVGVRLLAGLLVAVMGAGVGLRADVSPDAAWRRLGAVTVALPAGDVIYVGGTFTQLSTPSTSRDQMYDRATGLVRPGCARSTRSDRGLTGVPDEQGGLFVPVTTGDTFEDGSGPLTLTVGTTLLRVRSDCTFDRSFATPVIDPTAPDDTAAGRPVQAGPFVLLAKVRTVGFVQASVVGKFDAATGARVDYREYTTARELRLLGAHAGRVIAAALDSAGVYRLATIDPVSLTLTLSSTELRDESLSPPFWVRAGTLYRWRPSPSNVLEAFDLATLASKSGWTNPVLPVLTDLEVVGARVFVTSTRTIASGVTALLPVPAALSAATGSVDATWSPPALRRLVDDPAVTYVPALTHLATDGQRLYMAGDFERVGTVERDGVAALDATTATLDPWTVAPLQAVPLEYSTGGLLMSRATSAGRIARRYLAALSRATGEVTDWNPNDPSRVQANAPTPAPVTALAADAAFVYFATDVTGELLRARRDTGVVDTTWRLAVKTATNGAGRVTSLALDGGVLFAGGEFASVTGPTIGTQSRGGIFAVDVAGPVLRPWAPVFEGPAGLPLVRALLPLAGRLYVGGAFSVVNGQSRSAFVGIDAVNAQAITPEMFTQPDTRITDMTTDGTQVFVTGAAFSAALVGAIPSPSTPSLTPFTVPSGLQPAGAAYLGGRLYAGREFDPSTGTVTSDATVWPRAVAAGTGLVVLRDSGAVEFYPAVAAGSPPVAPTNLAAVVAGTTVTFSWQWADPDTAGRPPTSFVLQAGSAAGLTDLAQLDTRSTETRFSVVAPEGTYYTRVVAKNGSGASSASNEVVVRVGQACTSPPAAPASLSASVSGTTLRLQWPAVVGATRYRVEAGRAAGQSDAAVVDAGTATELSGTAATGTYYLRVRALNACGTGAATPDAVVTVGGLPGMPRNLAASVSATRTVTLTWAAPTDGSAPTGYRLEAGRAPGASDVAVVMVSGLDFTAIAVPPGTYYVRVRSRTASVMGAATADIVVVVP